MTLKKLSVLYFVLLLAACDTNSPPGLGGLITSPDTGGTNPPDSGGNSGDASGSLIEFSPSTLSINTRSVSVAWSIPSSRSLLKISSAASDNPRWTNYRVCIRDKSQGGTPCTELKTGQSSDGGFTLTLGEDISLPEFMLLDDNPLEMSLLKGGEKVGEAQIDLSQIAPEGTVNTLIQYIKAIEPQTEERFGSAVSFSGDGKIMAVGAPGHTASGIKGGAVYIFEDNAQTGWTQTALLVASSQEAEDKMGATVSLSEDGTRLAVGVPDKDSSTATETEDIALSNTGAVLIFIKENNTWRQEASLESNATANNGRFGGQGMSLSADGNTLAVGTVILDKVDTFKRNNDGTWSFLSRISPTPTRQLFGFDLSLSRDGNLIAISAPRNSVNEDGTAETPANKGAIYLFRKNTAGDDYAQVAYLKPSENIADQFLGRQIDMTKDGKFIIAGGSIRANLFRSNVENQWTETLRIQTNALTGFLPSVLRVSEDGSQIFYGGFDSSDLVGINPSPKASTETEVNGSGAVYVFDSTQTGSTSTPSYFIKAPTLGEEDDFGSSLDITDDARKLSVGAPREDSISVGVNGDQNNDDRLNSGAAYVYYF